MGDMEMEWREGERASGGVRAVCVCVTGGDGELLTNVAPMGGPHGGMIKRGMIKKNGDVPTKKVYKKNNHPLSLFIFQHPRRPSSSLRRRAASSGHPGTRGSAPTFPIPLAATGGRTRLPVVGPTAAVASSSAPGGGPTGKEPTTLPEPALSKSWAI